MTETTQAIKLDLPLEEYSKRKNVELEECYLMLDKEFVHYKVKASYDSTDDDTGIVQPTRANYRWCRRRELLSEVSIYFDNKEKMYSVEIEF